MCGSEPQMYYDNDEYDALYNIKCCVFHVRNYRVTTFKEWNELMIKTKTKLIEVEDFEEIKCDICEKVFKVTDKTTDNTLEIQEFTYIRFRGGYGSVFGDDVEVECDICQHCLYDFIKDKYRF